MGKLRWERTLAFDSCDDLQRAAAVGAVLNIDIEHPLRRALAF
ncbi:MAG: hypothetical protein ACREXY_05705 [Gammaproteobacteria bacterium]